MKVKALREHFNSYGDKRAKAKGDTYEIADEREAQNLIDQGLVEAAGGKGKADGVS